DRGSGSRAAGTAAAGGPAKPGRAAVAAGPAEATDRPVIIEAAVGDRELPVIVDRAAQGPAAAAARAAVSAGDPGCATGAAMAAIAAHGRVGQEAAERERG